MRQPPSFGQTAAGAASAGPRTGASAPAVPRNGDQPGAPEPHLYPPGTVLGGRYTVLALLGRGGFGVVYQARCHDTGDIVALKTLRNELMDSAAQRQSFQREALTWTQIEEHPFILPARWVEVFSGRPFVATDYVAPDGAKRVTLLDHLPGNREPLELGQALRWAVQCCYGMEHARACGIRCHRDLKPANILITAERTARVSDFGLAAVGSPPTTERAGGTLGYSAPELYRGEPGDVRSDVYSFGLVLWQMATGSQETPFCACRDEEAVYDLQMRGLVRGVEGPLDSAVRRCLSPCPTQRFPDFRALREELAVLLRRHAGQSVSVPPVAPRGTAFWYNKGRTLCLLSHFTEAIQCFDRALDADPHNANAWNNKGTALRALKRHREAIGCFDQALAREPRNPYAWTNRGCCWEDLEQYDEALASFRRALEIEPHLGYTLNHQGSVLVHLQRYTDAVCSFSEAIHIDPYDVVAWNNKSNTLNQLGRYEEARRCARQALAIDPLYSPALYNQAISLSQLEQYNEALDCCARALALDPTLSGAWVVSGYCQRRLGNGKKGIESLDRALALDDRNARAWHHRGCCLSDLGHLDDAIRDYDRALALRPRFADAWFKKAEAETDLGRAEAAASWRHYLKLAAGDPAQCAWVTAAQERLAESLQRTGEPDAPNHPR
jgi:tetratricopeptide (TPR) repeat protein